jgi:hypothetical protein
MNSSVQVLVVVASLALGVIFGAYVASTRVEREYSKKGSIILWVEHDNARGTVRQCFALAVKSHAPTCSDWVR